MRELVIHSPQKSFLPQLGILTNVVELTHYELLYIHHKLKDKDHLELRRELNPIFDKYAIEVFFNNRKLGYVSNKVNTIIARHMDQGKQVYARIKNIKTNRMMPLTDLEIEIIIM